MRSCWTSAWSWARRGVGGGKGGGPVCPPLRRGGRSPVPPVPAVAGDRAVAIHRAVVLIEGWVLQTRFQAVHPPRGLCHAKERQTLLIRLRGKAFQLLQPGYGAMAGPMSSGLYVTGERGRCLQTRGLSILSPGGSDEDSSSPDSEALVCKEKEPPSLVVQACYVNY